MIQKVAIDQNQNVMAFIYQSSSLEIEADVPDEFIGEDIFSPQQCNRFKVVDGKVVRRTEEEIIKDPVYSIVLDEQKRTAFKDKTDPEIIRAVRELLKDPEIRAKLSSETQQRLVNTELEVEKIKINEK
jgi:hypothetical protein